MIPLTMGSARRVSGRALRGAMRLENGTLALVFDGGLAVAVERGWLMREDEAAFAFERAAERLAEAGAEIAALRDATGSRQEPDVREEATRLRDAAAVAPRRHVGTVGEAPEFMPGAEFIGLDEMDQRVRTEAVAREVPDV